VVGKLTKHPLFAGIYLLFFLLVVVPTVYSFIYVLFFENSFQETAKLINNSTLTLLLSSIAIAGTIAILSTVLGTLQAFLLYKIQTPFSSWFKLLLLLPLFISPYIWAVAWKDFFYFAFNNTKLISSVGGLIFVHTSIYTPLAMLIAGSGFQNINSQLEESGLVITNFKSVIVRIIIPLIKPAIASSFILIFIFSISEFSVPAFLGVKVFTTEIFTQFSAFYNHSLALLQSVLLVVICFLLLLSEKKYIASAPFLSVGSKGSNYKIYKLKYSNIGLLFIFLWFVIFVILPPVMLAFQTFNTNINYFTKAFYLLQSSIAPSIFLSLISAFIIVFAGFNIAFFTKNSKNSTINIFLLITFIIPTIVLGISIIKFYNRPALNFIYGSYAIIIIGYIAKFLFITVKLIDNAVKKIPSSLDEAAQIAGVSLLGRIIRIYFPLSLQAVFVSFIIVFIFSLSELGTTIMVYPPGSELMQIKVFTVSANAPLPLTSGMSLIVFLITLIVTGILFLIIKPFFNNDRTKKYKSLLRRQTSIK
jgi:ABC-type Fe3+ transport system permease subunit